jgi:hypothetical protein
MSITPTKKPVETQRTSTALEAYRFLGEGKNAASLKQIRAALSFVYKHWDLKNPFAKIEPPLHKARLKYSGQTRLIPGQIAPYFAPGPTTAG